MKTNTQEDRLPPSDAGAERAVLGAVFQDPEALVTCLERLRDGAREFYDLRHQVVYETMRALFERAGRVDLVTVFSGLPAAHKEAVTAGFLAELGSEAGSAVNAGHYCEIVHEKYLLRRAVALGTDLARRAMEADAKAAVVLETGEREVLDLSAARAGQAEVKAKDLVLAALTRYENYRRGVAQGNAIATRYKYLDRLLGGGLHPGQLVILAARPSQGKTSLLTMFAQQMAIDGGAPVGIFSLEMTRDELTDRILFQRARADYQRYRTGFLEMEDLARVLTLPSEEVGKAPIWIDDTPGLNCMEIRARARRMARQYELRAVFVDYLQLVGPSQRYEVREQEVAEVSRTMKALAKELGIPVVLAAQLNRETEKNKGRAPMLSDLRESGAIEQDADVVAALYRPEIKEEEEAKLAALTPAGDWTGKVARVDLLILKQRNGPSDKPAELIFRKSSMRFESWNRNRGTYEGCHGMDLDGWLLPRQEEGGELENRGEGETGTVDRELPAMAELFPEKLKS